MNSINDTESINTIIEQALLEDLGNEGDITSGAVFTTADQAKAIIKSKDRGILSGVYLLKPLFNKINKTLSVRLKAEEGANLKTGTEICLLSGPIQSILSGERVALNFLQRLSGIATKTSQLNMLIKGTKAKLLDTRKTTPLMRILEKRAVIAGGGYNHRMGLFDMILIKDTHVKGAGGPGAAVQKAREFSKTKPEIKIEVEVQSTDEFFEAFEAQPNRIMLDNMTLDEMHECVEYRNNAGSSIELEASGNITEDTIRAIAETGVDYISVGALTHSVKALDIHLVLL
jgi:nicotinate-nucleotide pyrophosphorylase (carboxylating)